jgi:hypothetical protein
MGSNNSKDVKYIYIFSKFKIILVIVTVNDSKSIENI